MNFLGGLFGIHMLKSEALTATKSPTSGFLSVRKDAKLIKRDGRRGEDLNFRPPWSRTAIQALLTRVVIFRIQTLWNETYVFILLNAVDGRSSRRL